MEDAKALDRKVRIEKIERWIKQNSPVKFHGYLVIEENNHDETLIDKEDDNKLSKKPIPKIKNMKKIMQFNSIKEIKEHYSWQ